MHRDRDTFEREKSTSKLLRERELAERWNFSVRTLQRWRHEGSGPAHILIGGAIRYRMNDIPDFEDRHRRSGSVGE